MLLDPLKGSVANDLTFLIGRPVQVREIRIGALPTIAHKNGAQQDLLPGSRLSTTSRPQLLWWQHNTVPERC